MAPSYCRRCLDAAASWYPEKTVRSKGVFSAPGARRTESRVSQTKAEYDDCTAVRTPARRLLHRLKFGDKSARARNAAADAAAATAREASDVTARAQLMEVTNLQVQIDIANHLRCLTQQLMSQTRGSAIPAPLMLPVRVGLEAMPAELGLAVDEEEEEEED
ncbi:hypothetical protein G7Z17_g272 [Cylindrodendrum hubeiense]|uniref:Uncharacterized protein n=1 Tax=Cylindrodendrum hubeiense TaxID=595255 RepID=A0A9P5HKI4_9HYPO|nr:hypothetical protein G7Z17_g272 [Cylindrodendrum hubeiense]